MNADGGCGIDGDWLGGLVVFDLWVNGGCSRNAPQREDKPTKTNQLTPPLLFSSSIYWLKRKEEGWVGLLLCWALLSLVGYGPHSAQWLRQRERTEPNNKAKFNSTSFHQQWSEINKLMKNWINWLMNWTANQAAPLRGKPKEKTKIHSSWRLNCWLISCGEMAGSYLSLKWVMAGDQPSAQLNFTQRQADCCLLVSSSLLFFVN